MAITKSDHRNVVRNVSTIQESCVDWLQDRALTSDYTGSDLYDQLFGDKPVITPRIKYSDAALQIEQVLKTALSREDSVFPTINLPQVRDSYFSFILRNLSHSSPTQASCVTLQIPTHKAVYEVTGLIYPMPYRTAPKAPRLLFSWHTVSGCPPEATREFFLPHIVATFGAEFIDKLNSIIAFYDMTVHASSNLDSYIEKCRSIGGLYKKLPILNTLVPAHIDHVTMTRQTPDPPDILVSQLNTLASVNSARTASGRQA
jgi:hypothetical protein